MVGGFYALLGAIGGSLLVGSCNETCILKERLYRIVGLEIGDSV